MADLMIRLGRLANGKASWLFDLFDLVDLFDLAGKWPQPALEALWDVVACMQTQGGHAEANSACPKGNFDT